MTHAGRLIRHWRLLRGKTQAELAEAAGVSTKQISFIETGRVNPSRAVLDYLVGALDLPARDEIAIQVSAGFLPSRALQQARPTNEEEQALIDSFAPYPAALIDDHWRIQSMNEAVLPCLARLGVLAELTKSDNLIHAFYTLVRAKVLNLDEVWPYVTASIRRQKSTAPQSTMVRVVEEAVAALGGPEPDAWVDEALGMQVPLRIQAPDQVLNLRSLNVQAISPLKVPLVGVRIVAFMPANAASRRWFWSR